MRKKSRAALVAALVAVSALGTTQVADADPGSRATATAYRATAVTVGQLQSGTSPCPDNVTVVQASPPASGVSYSMPTAGVVTAFSTTSVGAGAIRGMIFRPSGANFTVVGKSATTLVQPGAVLTIPVRIPVVAGDQLGMHVSGADVTCGAMATGGTAPYSTTYDPDSSNVLAPTGIQTGVALNITATLEPDADGDGFGDVTQDACPQAAAQTTCPAPVTKVKKAPPAAGSDRHVVIKFKSTVKGSTFTCQLDFGRAKPCKSPYRTTVGDGRHVVKIRALSPQGVAEAKPAKVKFRVTAG